MIVGWDVRPSVTVTRSRRKRKNLSKLWAALCFGSRLHATEPKRQRVTTTAKELHSERDCGGESQVFVASTDGDFFAGSLKMKYGKLILGLIKAPFVSLVPHWQYFFHQLAIRHYSNWTVIDMRAKRSFIDYKKWFDFPVTGEYKVKFIQY